VHGDGWLSADKPEDVGDDEAATDAFTYDPTDPVPSIGGRFQASVPGGPYDQRPLLGRPDVLVYTTAPLKKDVEVTGPITVTLYAASSARDTDFVAKLDDVYPQQQLPHVRSQPEHRPRLRGGYGAADRRPDHLPRRRPSVLGDAAHRRGRAGGLTHRPSAPRQLFFKAAAGAAGWCPSSPEQLGIA
jgi:hypothetical protein